ncbi:MAG: DUF899 domain-containing protein [Tabrizicola sp.]|nr:DUF899 domain-containing protein [Tabrizicola sp.]
MGPRIVSSEVWRAERLALLAEEKAFDRARDALSERRRALPATAVTQTYLFATETGPATLADLFGGRRQLVVYHFMYGADWAQGCPSCSFWADNFDGIGVHLAHRDTSLVAVSIAPLAKLLAYRDRMGWGFPWVSSAGTRFNQDFGVTMPEDEPVPEYNYAPRPGATGELPGISVFLLDQGRVLHSYSTYARGLDMLNGAYHFLDLTPLGRQEADLPWSMAWVRRHDQY